MATLSREFIEQDKSKRKTARCNRLAKNQDCPQDNPKRGIGS
jgi:hypothetical protein